MGWNNYNAWHTDFNETLVLSQAQAIKDKGLQGLGYTYINRMIEHDQNHIPAGAYTCDS